MSFTVTTRPNRPNRSMITGKKEGGKPIRAMFRAGSTVRLTDEQAAEFRRDATEQGILGDYTVAPYAPATTAPDPAVAADAEAEAPPVAEVPTEPAPASTTARTRR